MMTTTIAALVSISEWIELSILVKATILLAFGLAAARVAARARASVRHLLLAATFATLVILPLVVIGAPDVTIEMPAASVSGQPARVRETQTSRTAPSQAGPVDPRATQALHSSVRRRLTKSAIGATLRALTAVKPVNVRP